ncbi:MAG: hypothetical protein J1F28_08910 [Oscillospiraceae bacterium]|nr:hypothetical protein [Oscillospiraceae bacterium]
MLYWELRKTVNVVIVLVAVVLCAGWFFVCRLLFIGNYENVNGAIYRSYIAELSGLTFEEQREYIEAESADIGGTLSAETEMRDKYFGGEITDEEYLDYLDLLEDCKARNKTFAYVRNKFERICEDQRLRFTYDLELEGHLTAMTADFPLIVMLLIVGCFVFIPDIPIEPFIATCENGRRKTFTAKIAAYFIICGIMIAAFNVSELAALFSKNLGDLSVPAASMEAFDALDRDITSSALIARTFLFRLLGEVTACAVFFALSSRCQNHIAYFCSAASLVMIPAFFANFIPGFLRGAIIYYALSGTSVLLDKTELAVMLGSLAWIAASFIFCKKPK